MYHALIILSVISCAFCGVINTEDFSLTIVPLDIVNTTSTRIIGGTPAAITRYPYTVQVLYNSRLFCGGSLLTTRHVLSAAHCFVDENNNLVSPRLYSIRAGSATLNVGGTVHQVSAIVVHERYNQPRHDNDVAVLLMTSAVTYSNSVAAASIPTQGSVVPYNSPVIHVGWGTTDVNVGTASTVLNEVTVYVVNHTVCTQEYLFLQTVLGEPFPVTDTMICAGVYGVGGRDACQGDSGGPLIYNNVVVGITSWGYGCAEARFPGVSARVASYTTWIQSTVSRIGSGSPLTTKSSVLLVTSFVFTVILNIVL